MSVLIAMSVGCSDKGGDDTDIDTGTDVGDPAEPVAVAGAVSGLYNGGVVLQLNGEFDLAVDADGSFVFDDEVLEGDAFDVTVLAEPTGQSCEVLGGAGTADGDVGGVEVVCGCDFESGLPVSRSAFSAYLNSDNALTYGVITPLRGIEATLDWEVSCGSEQHSVLSSGTVAPGLEGTALEGATVGGAEPMAWTGSTAWSLVSLYPNDLRGLNESLTVYKTSPPSWQPEAVLYPQDIDDTMSIEAVLSLDVGADGTVVSQVVLTDGTDYRLGVAKVADGEVSIAFDIADGVNVGDETQTLCSLGEPSWSADGHMVVPVLYGSSCGDRAWTGRYNAVVAVSDGGEPRLLLEANADVGGAGLLMEVADVRTDDVGHAIIREWRCPPESACRLRPGGSGIVQVDLRSDEVVPVARFGGAVGDNLVVNDLGVFAVTPTGEVALHIGAVVDDCRRIIGCANSHVTALWDGALHQTVASGQQYAGYITDEAVTAVLPTASGGLGIIGGVWQGSPNTNPHDALLCWNSDDGGSMALGRATADINPVEVFSVAQASMNADGNYAAVVLSGNGRTPMMLLGTCP